MRQDQFLEVVDRDEAERRWQRALRLDVLPSEEVELAASLGRVVAEDVQSAVDVPSFDRSNMDGFAVRSTDTFGATEEAPVRLHLNTESIPTGVAPRTEVKPGTTSSIATGGMLPRGADAVVPVEWTDIEADEVVVRAALAPGASVSYAGSDVAAGETVVAAGCLLASRDTGVLAAVGAESVRVVRRPRFAVISTGDEIISPGEVMRPGMVYDSNGRIVSDALAEIGAEAVFLGAFRDDLEALREALASGLASCDGVVLSGGTSKGEGDLSYRVVAELEPGIQVHGVALKPGKPICLAASEGKPVVILPGFPTSAIFTFHEFVVPVVLCLAGRRAKPRSILRAPLAVGVRSSRGRLEYLLVRAVVQPSGGHVLFPMGQGSGSVTTFSRADGFVRIGRRIEILEAGDEVEVTLLRSAASPADLVIIGSHCLGLDVIARAMGRRGLAVEIIPAGSRGGLEAARRGECDVAPIHLLDAKSGEYNRPFLTDDLELVEGYWRMQGVVTRREEERGTDELLADSSLRMVNRNPGSGTRVLLDELLGAARPDGYSYEPRSHQAVAAAVAQHRADWGMTIETAARRSGLRFRPLREEHYDFAIPRERLERPAVRAFVELLAADSEVDRELAAMGLRRRRSTAVSEELDRRI